MNVEVGYPLFLHDSVLLDGERFSISGDTDFAVGSRVKVVDLLPALVADLGASV